VSRVLAARQLDHVVTLAELVQAERYYKTASGLKRSALQPYHGLIQLYRRIGNHIKQAEALRHVIAHSSMDQASQVKQRIELIRALLQSKPPQAAEASEVLAAVEDALHDGVSDEHFQFPEEIYMLKADCQLALDETEYNTRVHATLDEARSKVNNVKDEQRDAVLVQEVAATWVRPRSAGLLQTCSTQATRHPAARVTAHALTHPRCAHVQAEEMLSRTDDAVERMAAAASSAPHPRLNKYQIEILKRVMAKIQGAPAGSAERHARRVAALQMCCDIVARGGCTSETPFELALRLLEVEEEVSAGCSVGAAGVYSSGHTSAARAMQRTTSSHSTHPLRAPTVPAPCAAKRVRGMQT
jgi:hypothetical protein